MAKFDYFSVSTYAHPEDLIRRFLVDFDLVSATQINPQNGFTKAFKIHRGEVTIAKVSWGNHDKLTVNIRASGEHSIEVERFVRNYLLEIGEDYWATRIDSCEDLRRSGGFDQLAAQAIAFAKRKNLKISQVGDWERGRERTLYIGSRTSEVHIRIYEKGQQLGMDPDWFRYEVEIKPSAKNRERRLQVVGMSPGELLFLGISGKLLNSIGWDHIEAIRLPHDYAQTTAEKARAALVKQYGNTIRKWASDLGGFDKLATKLEAELCPELTD
jgi:hypothetical protein